MSEPAVRLQKAIARAGLASRRAAERLIEAGSVRVNGRVVREAGTSLLPGQDLLEVDGRPVAWEEPRSREVWALYKPKGCVSTLHDPQGRATIRDFFPRTGTRLFPVGRLDYDTEGLILITNDGELANRVAHPSHSVEKTYLVKVRGLVNPESLKSLQKGPILGGRKKRPVRAHLLHTVNDKTWLEVTLQEGTHHHIKKMFAAEGFPVLKIKRYRIGPVALQNLVPGEIRRLNAREIAVLAGEPAAAGARPANRSARRDRKRTLDPPPVPGAGPHPR